MRTGIEQLEEVHLSHEEAMALAAELGGDTRLCG
ncbi:Uncharacterised protein [Yersinia nurmii]|uniref:Uncharacterized protein n=1 Tax=Yersinia nurmii TaxID=685706 RepID=A0ABP1YJH2_9GAMM|nr:Uncharacterised protein [Yersinia nurmii]